jgi:uncharacterized damage-inducible protein DinB
VARNEITLLLELLDRAYNRQSWHGPNLRGAIRRVDATTAAWRPGRGRRNIWEHVVHAAYWKYAVRRRLLDEKRGSFPLEGSNWFARPVVAGADAWQADVALLDETHRALRAAIAGLRPADLWRTAPGRKVTNLALIGGIAAHDVYHAGQIQLLKRLAAHGARR